MNSRSERGACPRDPSIGGRDERGVALLVTILVIALLATLTFEMSYMTLVDMNIARNVASSTRLIFLAEAGIGVGRAALAIDRKNNATDNLSEIWADGAPVRALPLGDAIVAIDISDEERKIPLNGLVTGTGEEAKVNEPLLACLQRLFTNLGLDPDIADAIVDWVDTDNIPGGKGGAEADYYRELKSPITIRNGPFVTLEELRLVRGVTAEVFAKVSPFLSVYPAAGKMNINTVSKTILMAASGEMTEERAKEFMEFRAETPFESAAKLKEYLAGFSPPLTDAEQAAGLFDVKSDNFSIVSTATLISPEEQESRETSSTGKDLLKAAGELGREKAKDKGKEKELTVRQRAARAGNTKSILAILRRGSDGRGELLYWRVD